MEIISKINWVDVLVVILMVRMSYVSLSEGLSHVIFPFIGSIAIMVFGLHYYERLGSALSRGMAGTPVELTNFISFLGIVIVIWLLVRLLKGLLDKVVKVQWHPLVEKFGGLALGIARAYIITSIVLTILVLIPVPYMAHSIRDKSLSGKHVLAAGPGIRDRVSFLLPSQKAKKPADKPS